MKHILCAIAVVLIFSENNAYPERFPLSPYEREKYDEVFEYWRNLQIQSADDYILFLKHTSTIVPEPSSRLRVALVFIEHMIVISPHLYVLLSENLETIFTERENACYELLHLNAPRAFRIKRLSESCLKRIAKFDDYKPYLDKFSVLEKAPESEEDDYIFRFIFEEYPKETFLYFAEITKLDVPLGDFSSERFKFCPDRKLALKLLERNDWWVQYYLQFNHSMCDEDLSDEIIETLRSSDNKYIQEYQTFLYFQEFKKSSSLDKEDILKSFKMRQYISDFSVLTQKMIDTKIAQSTFNEILDLILNDSVNYMHDYFEELGSQLKKNAAQTNMDEWYIDFILRNYEREDFFYPARALKTFYDDTFMAGYMEQKTLLEVLGNMFNLADITNQYSAFYMLSDMSEKIPGLNVEILNILKAHVPPTISGDVFISSFELDKFEERVNQKIKDLESKFPE